MRLSWCIIFFTSTNKHTSYYLMSVRKFYGFYLERLYKHKISDYNYYARNSGMFTYVSDAHGTTSWLDPLLCSQDMPTKLHSIVILDMLPSSDHVPLSFVFDFNSFLTFNDTFTCLSNKTNFN